MRMVARDLEHDYLRDFEWQLLQKLLLREKQVPIDFLVEGPPLSTRLEISRTPDLQLESRIEGWKLARSYSRAFVKYNLRDLVGEEDRLQCGRCVSLCLMAQGAVDHAIKATYLGLKIEFAQMVLEEKRGDSLASAFDKMFSAQ